MTKEELDKYIKYSTAYWYCSVDVYKECLDAIKIIPLKTN